MDSGSVGFNYHAQFLVLLAVNGEVVLAVYQLADAAAFVSYHHVKTIVTTCHVGILPGQLADNVHRSWILTDIYFHILLLLRQRAEMEW